jgi:hypothetical protein
MVQHDRDVRFCAKSRQSASQQKYLFDDLVSDLVEMRRHVEAQCFGDLEIDDKLILRRCLHRHVGRLLALVDAVDIAGRAGTCTSAAPWCSPWTARRASANPMPPRRHTLEPAAIAMIIRIGMLRFSNGCCGFVIRSAVAKCGRSIRFGLPFFELSTRGRNAATAGKLLNVSSNIVTPKLRSAAPTSVIA